MSAQTPGVSGGGGGWVTPSAGGHRALIGALLDERYEVVELLHRGVCADVYRARHRVLKRQFALKVLRARQEASPPLAASFLREAKAIASLEHPHLVRVVDSGTLATGQPFVALEYLEGTTLEAYLLEREPLEFQRAAAWMHGPAEALVLLHKHGFCHGHLSPRALFVCDEPMVGFGTLRLLGLGWYGGAAPRFSPGDDVVAMAQILTVMTGEHPFEGEEDATAREFGQLIRLGRQGAIADSRLWAESLGRFGAQAVSPEWPIGPGFAPSGQSAGGAPEISREASAPLRLPEARLAVGPRRLSVRRVPVEPAFSNPEQLASGEFASLVASEVQPSSLGTVQRRSAGGKFRLWAFVGCCLALSAMLVLEQVVRSGARVLAPVIGEGGLRLISDRLGSDP